MIPSDVSRETLEKLLIYSQLVFEWNQRVNLTGAKSVSEFFESQVLDCLCAGLIVSEREPWVDVGTGSGLPGIVWALLFPKSQFYLVEVKEKKVSFIYRAVSLLKISNIKVINKRFEQVTRLDLENIEEGGVNFVSRGTASPPDLMNLASKTSLLWKKWFVFVSEASGREFSSQANVYNLETEIISYPKYPVDSPSKTLNLQGFFCVMQPCAKSQL